VPNVPQGVAPPGAEEAVNTAAGFEAAMASKGVHRVEEDGEATDSDIASGLTFGGDPFAPPPAVSLPPVEEEESEADPLEEYIATRHGGDRDAALAALHQEATNQRSVIGRQGQELGDVRKMREEMAEMRGQLNAFASLAASPPGPASGEDADMAASNLIERMGYEAAATEAANIAHQTGDPSVYHRVLEGWSLEAPAAAMDFAADFRAWQRDEASAAERPAVTDEWVEEQKSVAAIQAPLERLSREMGEEQWAVVAPRMEKALEALPQGVAEMVVSTDPETAYQGIQIVGERAYLLGLAEEQTKARRQQTKMSGARVATGSLRPPVVPSSGEHTPEAVAQAKQRFKQQIMETETTDVRSGLTFGQAARPGS